MPKSREPPSPARTPPAGAGDLWLNRTGCSPSAWDLSLQPPGQRTGPASAGHTCARTSERATSTSSPATRPEDSGSNAACVLSTSCYLQWRCEMYLRPKGSLLRSSDSSLWERWSRHSSASGPVACGRSREPQTELAAHARDHAAARSGSDCLCVRHVFSTCYTVTVTKVDERAPPEANTQGLHLNALGVRTHRGHRQGHVRSGSGPCARSLAPFPGFILEKQHSPLPGAWL